MALSLYRFRYYNLSQLKLYVEEKTNDTAGDTTKFTVQQTIMKPLTSVNTGTSTPFGCDEINYWHSLLNELVERILLCTIKESGLQTCQTYQNIIQTLSKVSLRYVTSLKFLEKMYL